jgi:hypothetical protein
MGNIVAEVRQLAEDTPNVIGLYWRMGRAEILFEFRAGTRPDHDFHMRTSAVAKPSWEWCWATRNDLTTNWTYTEWSPIWRRPESEPERPLDSLARIAMCRLAEDTQSVVELYWHPQTGTFVFEFEDGKYPCGSFFSRADAAGVWTWTPYATVRAARSKPQLLWKRPHMLLDAAWAGRNLPPPSVAAPSLDGEAIALAKAAPTVLAVYSLMGERRVFLFVGESGSKPSARFTEAADRRIFNRGAFWSWVASTGSWVAPGVWERLWVRTFTPVAKAVVEPKPIAQLTPRDLYFEHRMYLTCANVESLHSGGIGHVPGVGISARPRPKPLSVENQWSPWGEDDL